MLLRKTGTCNARELTLSMAGMRKARVLPVPVLALQTRSTPDKKTGNEAACTFVHVSYFIVSSALQEFKLSPIVGQMGSGSFLDSIFWQMCRQYNRPSGPQIMCSSLLWRSSCLSCLHHALYAVKIRSSFPEGDPKKEDFCGLPLTSQERACFVRVYTIVVATKGNECLGRETMVADLLVSAVNGRLSNLTSVMYCRVVLLMSCFGILGMLP